MNDLILHHYPPSPVSEKIRVALGIKQASWHSVEQNRLPDRPELFAMSGGYRRIPVLQCGADIYCDTQCILKELERRIPSPSLHAAGEHGLASGLARWLDGEVFELAVRTAFAPVLDSLSPELVADRTRLYFGPDGDMQREAADMPHTLAQLRAPLGWLERQLGLAETHYMFGNAPGMADLLAWYVVWFVSGRYVDAERFLGEFPTLGLWAERMRAIGHGSPADMTPGDALQIALESDPCTAPMHDPRDPQKLEPGMPASVRPLSRNDIECAVHGIIRAVSADHIAIERHEPACGDVVVHFPRVGYRVTIDT